MFDSEMLRVRLVYLFTGAALSVSAPVGAQLYATPAQPVDQVHYVTAPGLSGLIGAGQIDPQSASVAIARVTAFGECVVSHDATGSAAYIRASVSADGEAAAYRTLRVAHRCEVLSHADHFWLGQSPVRQSAIADALRARLAP